MTLEQQIKEADAQFAETFNRGDIDALETIHEDDAMISLHRRNPFVLLLY